MSAVLFSGSSKAEAVDPVKVGMKAYADYARNERWDLVRHYDAPDAQYQEALNAYQLKLVQTVGLVSTSVAFQEQPKENERPQLVVGLGLAGRAIDKVLAHEVEERIAITDSVFAESRRVRGSFMLGIIKHGPAEYIAKKYPTADPYSYEYIAMGAIEGSPHAADLLDASSTEPVALEAVSLKVIQGIVPVQTTIERGAYMEAANRS